MYSSRISRDPAQRCRGDHERGRVRDDEPFRQAAPLALLRDGGKPQPLQLAKVVVHLLPRNTEMCREPGGGGRLIQLGQQPVAERTEGGRRGSTQWIVEARDGGVCVVRVVHSLFASTDDWDSQLEGWESGWPGFFRLLRMYLAHFSGQPCSAFQLTGFAPAPRDAAWRALFKGLGLGAVTTGQRAQSSGAAPDMSGTVERVGEAAYPEELLLRLDAPAPGIAHMFAMDMGEQVLLSIRFYLYGSTAAGVVVREEPAWQAWLGETFPGKQIPSDTCA